MKLICTSLNFREKPIRLSALLDGSGRPILFDVPGESEPLVGSIFVGRIASIVPEINAAFIEYAPGQRAFFSLEEPEGTFVKRARPKKLTVGDELLIEITREPVGEKPASASSDLKLKNDCLIISSAKSTKGVSKKITDPEKRRELKEWVGARKTGAGVIVRTKAAGMTIESLERSYDGLIAEYDGLMMKAPHLVPFSVLRKQKRDELCLIDHIGADEIEEAVTDDTVLFSVLSEEGLPFPVRLYDGTLPLAKTFSLETRLEEALAKKVFMKSGAFLYIEPTEALTVIDVNSGKSRNTALEVNLEATEEIVRQLMLRNISGIVIVDFINMKQEESYRILRAALEDICRNDMGGTIFAGFTALGLCELTRKKIKKPLCEQLIKP